MTAQAVRPSAASAARSGSATRQQSVTSAPGAGSRSKTTRSCVAGPAPARHCGTCTWYAPRLAIATSAAVEVPRLYDVTAGRLLIDGVDVRDLSFDTLADAVGVVSQETYLFHASVADNLRFAKPGATDEELRAAAEAAQIHEHIASLPDGYGTLVGERGYRFSGGEKQRLAIARTILRDPPILILDEATSALDTRTEHAVQRAIDALAANRTTITIAHRLSTVRDADQIVVLADGDVVERGTHEELMREQGRYAALNTRSRLGVGGPTGRLTSTPDAPHASRSPRPPRVARRAQPTARAGGRRVAVWRVGARRVSARTVVTMRALPQI